MYGLGLAFRKWIDFKMETDPFWKVREGGREDEGGREGGLAAISREGKRGPEWPKTHRSLSMSMSINTECCIE
jgi:hypothetical protein